MFANHAAKLSVSGKQRPSFPATRKDVRVSCKKLCGIVPVSLLSLRKRLIRRVSLPSSGGIGPSSPLFQRVSVNRFERSPSSGGMGPVRAL